MASKKNIIRMLFGGGWATDFGREHSLQSDLFRLMISFLHNQHRPICIEGYWTVNET